MFDVNQFIIMGKYLKIDKSYLYIKVADDQMLKLFITNGLKEKLIEFCSINETIAIKGVITSNNKYNAILKATKISFISNKH